MPWDSAPFMPVDAPESFFGAAEGAACSVAGALWVGAAPDARDPVPTAFVIDARLKPGDGEFQSTLEGWFAAIAEPAASGEVTGTCVEKHCALTVDLDGPKLSLIGDFVDAAGPVTARFVLNRENGNHAAIGFQPHPARESRVA